jgi:hypothetical protein
MARERNTGEEASGCLVAADVIRIGVGDEQQAHVVRVVPNRLDRGQVNRFRRVGQPGVDQDEPVSRQEIHRHRLGPYRELDAMDMGGNFHIDLLVYSSNWNNEQPPSASKTEPVM